VKCEGIAIALASFVSGHFKQSCHGKFFPQLSLCLDHAKTSFRLVMMSEGYIYILFNQSFRNDFYKIGKTTRTPEQRAQELSSATGVPEVFEVLYKRKVADCDWAKQLVHERLEIYRTSTSRDFFEVPSEIAIYAIEEVANAVGTV
jgi:hypothetical protein